MRSIKLPSWISRPLGVDDRCAPPHVFAIGEGVISYARFGAVGRDDSALVLEEVSERKLPSALLGSGPLGGPIRDQGAVEELIAEFVGALSNSVTKASLVLPDTWVRVVFVEGNDLPRTERAREEVLQWKLNQQVPFRAEDLRICGVEVTPLQDQDEPRRLLVGFGVEQFLRGFELAFSKAGVEIGHISNRSMCFTEALASGEGGEVFLFGTTDGYSLVVLGQGEPVLFRSKRLEPGLSAEVVVGMVERDLRLTLGFFTRRTVGMTLDRVVVGGESDSRLWLDAARRSVESRDGESLSPEVVLAGTAVRGRVELGRVGLGGEELGEASQAGDHWLPLFGAAQRSVA